MFWAVRVGIATRVGFVLDKARVQRNSAPRKFRRHCDRVVAHGDAVALLGKGCRDGCCKRRLAVTGVACMGRTGNMTRKSAPIKPVSIPIVQMRTMGFPGMPCAAILREEGVRI